MIMVVGVWSTKQYSCHTQPNVRVSRSLVWVWTTIRTKQISVGTVLTKYIFASASQPRVRRAFSIYQLIVQSAVQWYV